MTRFSAVSPHIAIPPACSARYPIGATSYSKRALPCGADASGGYSQMPP